MMIEKVGLPAMLEQTAEECNELAKVLLKKARKLRGENPTPLSMQEIDESIREEYTDMIQCTRELNLSVNWEQLRAKEERFTQRWSESHEGEPET
jgi:NTP pyrophosphatase (non-canonical NTP hydrolase)